MPQAEITIPVDNGTATMPAALIESASPTGAGLVLVQEIFGRSDYMRTRAEDLATLGYTVVLPQLFWRIGLDSIPEGSPDALQVAMGHVQTVDWDKAVADVRDSVTWLRGELATDASVGLVGFCFGGGLAYAALQDAEGAGRADALVSYYGSALPGLVAGSAVTVPSLHHFGDSDAFIPAESVSHIRDVVTQHGADFHLWEGANHAFDNPLLPGLHHAAASRDAWDVTAAWLTNLSSSR